MFLGDYLDDAMRNGAHAMRPCGYVSSPPPILPVENLEVQSVILHRFRNDSSCRSPSQEIHSDMSHHERLKSWIDTLDDSELLEALDDIRRSASDSDWWTSLTETDIASVRNGLSDLDCSRIVSTQHLLSELRDAPKKR